MGGARPELVRYHLFFGPWDVRLVWVHVAGVLRLNSAAYLHIAGRGSSSVEQYYGQPFKTADGHLHGSVSSPCEDSGSRGWDPEVLLVRPSPFPSALIQRADSLPPLPRVELIQKVSTTNPH